jgi:hypothetical protein
MPDRRPLDASDAAATASGMAFTRRTPERRALERRTGPPDAGARSDRLGAARLPASGTRARLAGVLTLSTVGAARITSEFAALRIGVACAGTPCGGLSWGGGLAVGVPALAGLSVGAGVATGVPCPPRASARAGSFGGLRSPRCLSARPGRSPG